MNTSIFNTLIPILDAHTLIFNAYSGAFVVIRDKVMTLAPSDIDNIRSSSPELYRQLCEGGMIVEEGINEVQLLEDRIYSTDNNMDEFILHINPTLDCNFRCWYCYENHLTGSRMSPAILESVRRFITKTIKSQEKLKLFSLDFFGGEPLLEFDHVVKPLTHYVSALCRNAGIKFNLHFTSNGFLLEPNKIEYLAQYNCGFQITLDGGKEFHDKTRFTKSGKFPSYAVIIDNIKSLISKGVEVILRINYTKYNIHSVPLILKDILDIEKVNKRYLLIDLQRVWQDRNAPDNCDEIANAIRKEFMIQGFTVLTNYLHHDVRQSCYGDKINHTLINYDGYVYGCTARDFTEANSIGVLNIDGSIDYKKEVYHDRNKSKLSKKICRECRVAPICGGGCKQRAYEDKDNPNCTFGYTEEDKDNMVLDIFEYSFLK